MANPYKIIEDERIEQGSFGLLHDYTELMLGKTSDAFVVHLFLLANAAKARNTTIPCQIVRDYREDCADALAELVVENLVEIDSTTDTLTLVNPARFVIWSREKSD